MATATQLRKLALGLPEVEERSHFQQPDFRVRNKIFAGLSEDERVGNLKLTPELQALVLSGHPEAFYPAAGAWGRGGWTHVKLARVQLGELRELLPEAWRLVAPKRLVAQYEGARSVTPATSPPRARSAPRERAGRARA